MDTDIRRPRDVVIMSFGYLHDAPPKAHIILEN